MKEYNLHWLWLQLQVSCLKSIQLELKKIIHWCCVFVEADKKGDIESVSTNKNEINGNASFPMAFDYETEGKMCNSELGRVESNYIFNFVYRALISQEAVHDDYSDWNIPFQAFLNGIERYKIVENMKIDLFAVYSPK